MPWTEARRYLHQTRTQRRERLFDLSMAVRAGMAEEKGWKAWMEALDD